MSKDTKKQRDQERADYKSSLRTLQIELVKVQKHIINYGHKVLIIFEGRDASGKDGAIKRIVQHLSPRETHAFGWRTTNACHRQSSDERAKTSASRRTLSRARADGHKGYFQDN